MTTLPTRTTGTTAGTTAGRPPRTPAARPVSAWAFAGVAVTSFGGPLALAALYAPGIVAGSAGASAGLAMVAAMAVFAVPLVIWLRYARQVNGAGGLYGFVAAAAGRRVTLLVTGLIVAGQLAIAAALGGVTLTHLATPVSSFGPRRPPGRWPPRPGRPRCCTSAAACRCSSAASWPARPGRSGAA